MKQHILRVFYPLAGIAIIVLAWHFYVVLMRVPLVLLPSPLQVAAAMMAQPRMLLEEAWVTALECVYGFLLAMGIGIPIAVVMTYSRIANQMFYPLLVASQSIPKVAVAPILLVWFGTGIESKLAMAFVIAFFPAVVDTATGLRSTSPELLELARSLQCSRLQTFFKIQLPSALPSIFSGAKIAVTLAVIGAVIGEFIGSNRRPRQPAADRQLAAQHAAGVGVAGGAERARHGPVRRRGASGEDTDAVGIRQRAQAVTITTLAAETLAAGGCDRNKSPRSLDLFGADGTLRTAQDRICGKHQRQTGG